MRARRQFDDGWRTTLLASLLYPIGPAAIVLMPMIVGGLIDTYGFSEQEAANIAALEGMGLVVSSVLAALWIRKVSWVGALVVAFLAYAALNAVSANLAGYTPLLVVRFLTGLAGGSLFAVSVAALGDNREPDRAFGLAQAVQGVLMLGAFSAAPGAAQGLGRGRAVLPARGRGPADAGDGLVVPRPGPHPRRRPPQRPGRDRGTPG